MAAPAVATSLIASECLWYSPSDLLLEPDCEHMSCDSDSLESVESGRARVIVRCYGWSKAAVTVGCLQSIDDVISQFGDYPMYRRPTGGRAILHGEDLTVIVAAPIGIGLSKRVNSDLTLIKRGVLSDYFTITEPIRLALADLGIDALYGRDAVHCNRGLQRVSADCFKTSTLCDLVDNQTGNKIVGSAMRRGRSAFLFQASLKQQPGFNIFGDDFLHALQTHLARYLSIEHWDFPN